ncbi:hypothetical protein [Propioniciclava soli]|uniref:hypothetical protein n=1 Tax=Propioniciclava soli TaxID=2775081 RepID=UPI001E5C737F|nr:hypothetical protein [Propioniciclava soli]
MDEATVQVFEAEDGFLVLGDEGTLAGVWGDQARGGVRRLSPTDVARIGRAMGEANNMWAESGRWVKLTKESAELLRKHGPVPNKAGDAISGVVRGKGGEIVKHLNFQKGLLVTPAGGAALAAMVTQQALQASLDEITTYLRTIDEKLDQLLKQRKNELLGRVGGVMLALEEAEAIYEHTGAVSEVTWSKVQANSLTLQTLQAESVAQLRASADNVAAARADTDRAAKAAEAARVEVGFWLGVLARSLALQDRQYVLELARVAEADAEHLDAHRRGIVIARAERSRKIAVALDAIARAVSEASSLTNFARVANPISAQRIVREANAIADAVNTFAEHAELTGLSAGRLEAVGWGTAAKALVADAAGQVSTTGADVAGRAKMFAKGMEDLRDRQILRSAERVEQKRRLRLGASAEAAEAEAADEGESPSI